MMRAPGPEPESLADTLSGGAHPCPIPDTHDRLQECHYWWHEMARNYHEPDPFRYSLGAFLQAARSVTLMLQKGKGLFDDFSWYSDWSESAKKDPVLAWANKSRVAVVHERSLEVKSWAEFRCVYPLGHPLRDPDENVVPIYLNPFLCTHYYMHSSDEVTDHLAGEDHSHRIVRHWEINGLPDRELLDVGAELFGLLAAVVAQAHDELGASLITATRDGTRLEKPTDGRMPCMVNPIKYRTATIKRRRGRVVWSDEPPNLHPRDP